jgi:nucleoside-diphosphate-sugar epimerase
VAVDASDAAALAEATRGADVIYNCANPVDYHRWAELWPPMAHALLDAAEANGAVLVTVGNLYGYGPVDRPITVDTPSSANGPKGRVRVQMWDEALERHRQGRVRVVEARAADFYGPRITDGGHLGERVVPKLLAGKGVVLLGDLDAAHSFTFVPDVARALLRLGGDERAWGRAWPVPTAPAVSQRRMVELLCSAAGVDRCPCDACRGPRCAGPAWRCPSCASSPRRATSSTAPSCWTPPPPRRPSATRRPRSRRAPRPRSSGGAPADEVCGGCPDSGLSPS